MTLIGIIVFIIILVVVILWIVKGGFKGKGTSTPSTMDSSGQEYGTAMETVYDENLQAEMANLKEADPGFSESVFKDKAQTIFLKIQQAWTQKKWELARPYETDTIFNRHQSQMDEYITGHKRNVLEDIIIGGIDIVKVQRDQYYDNIIVRIKAQMLDYDIDETTKQVISGDNKTPRSFSEYWTFTRKAGVKSKGPEGVASDKCPNCGAPLNINQSGQCEYCGSIVTKGDFDWVLSSIVQDEEYQG